MRQELNRYAGPEGLTEEKRQVDDQYIAANGRDRPWLAEAANEAPEVRHIICERDRAGGHDPARHDGWRDAHAQEQRAAAAKDPAHPTDSPSYHNSVDWFNTDPLPENGVGGKKKQHTLGELTSRVPDRTAWAAATVRALDHPSVKEAMNSDKPPQNVTVPLDDVLGPDGHRKVEGYTLESEGFPSVKGAIDNRDGWAAEKRRASRDYGLDHESAEALVEQMAADGDILWTKPAAKPIESFEGGTCQVNFKLKKDGMIEKISTICYNPASDLKETS